jgi:hypothetical protein
MRCKRAAEEKAFVLDGSMKQNLKNELTSPRFCGGAAYRAENMNWIGERRHEIAMQRDGASAQCTMAGDENRNSFRRKLTFSW